MRGMWHEPNWRLEDGALILPNGHRLTLASIRQWQLNLYSGTADLTGKWSGWRIRQQWLIPPGGSIRTRRLSESGARHAAQVETWNHHETSRRQLNLF